MTIRWIAGAVCLAGVGLTGCGGKDATPTGPSPGTPVNTATTTARITDVLTGNNIQGVTAAGAGITGAASDGAGVMTLGAEVGMPDAARPVTFSFAGAVNREVPVKIPGANVAVSLIPTTFDLEAFDEMMRSVQLNRWTSAPPLRVQSRLLQFTSVTAADAEGLDEVLTTEERETLEADLTWALPQLTGGQFQAFASITRETVDVGARMSVLNSGLITVARYNGLQAATGYWGYARWQYRSDGAVIGGTIMLDRGFDRSGSVYRRSLRAHELGHALGYNHVTRRASVMNTSATIEPNAFDINAARIGFARPPGNRRPDIDPSGTSANVAAMWAIWHVGAR